jgi:peptidoglycan hydrolase-like protein with peptidoglycan-binding domain
VKELQAELEKALTEKDEALTEKDAVVAEKEEAKKASDEARQDFEAKINELVAQVEELTTSNTDLQKLNDSIEKAGADLQKKLESLTADNAELLENFTALQGEKDELTETIASLTGEKDELTEMLDSLTSEKDELTKNLQALTDENTGLQSESASLSDLVKQLTIQLDPAMISDSADGQLSDDEIVLTDSITIEIVQDALQKLGASISVDGAFGEQTAEAVRNFAKEHNLESDGKITLSLVNAMVDGGFITDERLESLGEDYYETWLSFANLDSSPDSYITTKLRYTGEILQEAAPENGKNGWIRLSVGDNTQDDLFVTVPDDVWSDDFMEGDTITVFGRGMGSYGYTSASGSEESVPWLLADIIQEAGSN